MIFTPLSRRSTIVWYCDFSPHWLYVVISSLYSGPKTRIWTWLSKLILHAKSQVTILKKKLTLFCLTVLVSISLFMSDVLHLSSYICLSVSLHDSLLFNRTLYERWAAAAAAEVMAAHITTEKRNAPKESCLFCLKKCCSMLLLLLYSPTPTTTLLLLLLRYGFFWCCGAFVGGGDSFKRILSLPIRNSSQDIRKKREFLQPAMNSMEQLQLSSFGVLLFRPSFRPNVVRNPHHMIWPFSLRFDQHNRDC